MLFLLSGYKAAEENDIFSGGAIRDDLFWSI
jgi:hypothetical protein